MRRDRCDRWLFVAIALLCGCSTTHAPHREEPAPPVVPAASPVRPPAFAGPLLRVESPPRAAPRPAVGASKPSLRPAAPGVPPDFLRLLMIREAERLKNGEP
ncbi:MAG: hypothetical protein ACYTGN_04845 [Planctomycetota bacterium]|jgi:hypothetical protein